MSIVLSYNFCGFCEAEQSHPERFVIIRPALAERINPFGIAAFASGKLAMIINQRLPCTLWVCWKRIKEFH